MQDSLIIFDQLEETGSFIQEIRPTNFLQDWYLLVSIILLLMIIIVKVVKDVRFTGTSERLFIEEATYSAFRGEKSSKLLNTLLDLNVLIQASFFIHFLFWPGFVAKGDFLAIASIFLILLSLLIFRLLSFSILKWITISKVNVKYYKFTLFNAYRVLSVLLMIFNLLWLSGYSFPFKSILVGILILFYSWLILRYLLIGIRYGVLRSLYFFVYLCALEIVPLLVLIKIGLSNS